MWKDELREEMVEQNKAARHIALLAQTEIHKLKEQLKRQQRETQKAERAQFAMELVIRNLKEKTSKLKEEQLLADAMLERARDENHQLKEQLDKVGAELKNTEYAKELLYTRLEQAVLVIETLKNRIRPCTHQCQ